MEYPKITLAAARVNAGLTQKEAAKLLNLTPATLQNYESGKTTPSWETARKIGSVQVPARFYFFAQSFALSEPRVRWDEEAGRTRDE